jgi:hypothetical protein
MFCRKSIFTLFLFLLLPPLTTAANKDPQALELIQQAIDAMGGVGAFAGIRDCTVQGQVQVAPDSPFYSGGFVWKNAGWEFRYENPRADGVQILASGHGKPATSQNGAVSPASLQAGLATTPPYLMPKLLVDALQNPNIEISSVLAGQVGGKTAVQIAVFDTSSKLATSLTSQVWYFDPSSTVPLRVEYREPSDSDANITVGVSVEFSDFRNVSGIGVPFQIASYQDDKLDSVFSLKSVQFNIGIDPSEFDLMGGGAQ